MIELVDGRAAGCSEGYVVETDTFSMIAMGEESLGRLGNDYSGSLLLPFYHSLRFEDLGKAESAEQLAIECCRFLNVRDLDLEVMNRMLELILQDRTQSISCLEKAVDDPI